MQTYDDDRFIVPKETRETEFYTRVIKTPYVVSKDITAPLSKAPCKCIAIEIEDLDKLEKFRQDMLPWAKEHHISLLYSSRYYLEVFPEKSGKGTSALILKNYLGNEKLITVGAGDEQNDISLLQACDVAIAMENAVDSVKNVATTISEDISDRDGLAKTLIDLI